MTSTIENVSNPLSLISEKMVLENLHAVFNDAIVLDTKFDIISISEGVLNLLHYDAVDILNKNLKIIGGDFIQLDLEKGLSKGYLKETDGFLYDKKKNKIQVKISGFYMGLISDFNGYIVLKIKNYQELVEIASKLSVTSEKLEHFLYRISHDLRGPLATIMGLAHIAKLERESSDISFYLDQIEVFADKMDFILKNIDYLTEMDNPRL